MSTYTAMHIESSDVEYVKKLLENSILESGRIPHVIENPTWLQYGFQWSNFLTNERQSTWFAIFELDKNWLWIYTNTFSTMENTMEYLSREWNTKVITVLAQSGSDVYHIGVFENGENKRCIQYVGDQWEFTINEWVPFSFESSPLGTNEAEDDEDPFYIFGREETEEYCLSLWLKLPWEGTAESVVPYLLEAQKKKWFFWKILWQ